MIPESQSKLPLLFVVSGRGGGVRLPLQHACSLLADILRPHVIRVVAAVAQDGHRIAGRVQPLVIARSQTREVSMGTSGNEATMLLLLSSLYVHERECVGREGYVSLK